MGERYADRRPDRERKLDETLREHEVIRPHAPPAGMATVRDGRKDRGVPAEAIRHQRADELRRQSIRVGAVALRSPSQEAPICLDAALEVFDAVTPAAVVPAVQLDVGTGGHELLTDGSSIFEEAALDECGQRDAERADDRDQLVEPRQRLVLLAVVVGLDVDRERRGRLREMAGAQREVGRRDEAGVIQKTSQSYGVTCQRRSPPAFSHAGGC